MCVYIFEYMYRNKEKLPIGNSQPTLIQELPSKMGKEPLKAKDHYRQLGTATSFISVKKERQGGRAIHALCIYRMAPINLLIQIPKLLQVPLPEINLGYVVPVQE